MKFAALILAAFTLFLSVKPGIEFAFSPTEIAEDCCNGLCSSDANDEQNHDEDEGHDDDCGNSCNPFQSCCAHVLMCQTKWIDVTSKITFPKKKKFARYNAAFASHFAADFWQPPRFV